LGLDFSGFIVALHVSFHNCSPQKKCLNAKGVQALLFQEYVVLLLAATYQTSRQRAQAKESEQGQWRSSLRQLLSIGALIRYGRVLVRTYAAGRWRRFLVRSFIDRAGRRILTCAGARRRSTLIGSRAAG